MSILSIQSHVVYGYVGNKAATYPLQSMGYDVWPVNTVQFSCHTGYKQWQGDVFSREHIKKVINGLENIGIAQKCKAILSGYMGSQETCEEVYETVNRFKMLNSDIIYLCDPVIGNTNCFVKPEVLNFFKNNLFADIITPNQFEAETLSNIKIIDKNSLNKAADYFHNLGIKIVVITGIKGLNFLNSKFCVFVSNAKEKYLVEVTEYNRETPINGTGDLFSALFLGTYLATKNILDAAQSAIYYMNIVVKNTIESSLQELQVTSTSYNATSKKNIEYLKID